MKKLRLELDELATGKHHNLTAPMGINLSHAAAVCLDSQGHECEVLLKGKGIYTGNYTLCRCEVTNQMKRSWADLQEATEEGACGVAILVVSKETKYKTIERSCKGTGIDYWLGDEDSFLLQRKARLEVSGTLEGDEKELKSRLQQKIEQTKRSDHTRLPAVVVIVGFKEPMVVCVERT